MRRTALLVALCGACASAGGGAGRDAGLEPSETTRVRAVYRHYRNQNIFVVENLAGRALGELRGKPLAAGETAVAYVPDDVMQEMLKEFRRIGYYRHAGPRPPDPIKVGATSEITLIDEERRFTSFLRMRGDDARTAESYNDLVNTFLAVWNHFHPFAQVSSGRDARFGVRDGDAGGP